MKINLTSFLIGIIFCLSIILFSGWLFTPKHLKVNSIEIIDDGTNNSGFIIVRNSNNDISTYLGVGKKNNGVLPLKIRKVKLKLILVAMKMEVTLDLLI